VDDDVIRNVECIIEWWW